MGASTSHAQLTVVPLQGVAAAMPLSALARVPTLEESAFYAALMEHQHVFEQLAPMAAQVQETAERLAACLSTGGKLLVCGIGVSAAQAQHVAAALGGWFARMRRPLAALALVVDAATLTCVTEDQQADEVFARQVRALGRPGDALLVISASSAPVQLLRAVQAAREIGMLAVGLAAAEDTALTQACHVALRVPSSHSVRVQEAQQFLANGLCASITAALAL